MMDKRKPTHVYIGRRPCGCIVAISSYAPWMRESTECAVADMIHDGEIVECMTWAEYQANKPALQDCPHGEVDQYGNQQPVLV